MAIEGIKDGLADAYESLHERVPYFPYILAAVLVAILGLAAYVFFSAGQDVRVAVMVQNAAGVGIRGAQVSISGLGEPVKLLTDTNGNAFFMAPASKDVTIEVSKEGYATQKRAVTVAGEGNERGTAPFVVKVTLVNAGSGPQQLSGDVTLTFVGPDGRKLAGKSVSVSLSCTGTGRFETPQYTVIKGELEITPPEKCGSIKVNASAANLQDSSATILGRAQEIYFRGIEKPKGSIDLEAKDEATGSFLDNIQVSLVDSLGQSNGFDTLTSFGQASFAGVEVGDYTAQFHDAAGQYADARMPVTIVEGDSGKKTAMLSKDVKLRVKAIVKEKNGPMIAGASVSLLAADSTVISTQRSEQDGSASFSVKDDGTYSIIAAKDSYLPGGTARFTTGSFARGSQQTFTAELEKCTQQTCGIVKIRVIDEDGLPVENARVSLLDKQGFAMSGPGQRTTDWNGHIVPFSSVPKGTYSALAQKFPSDGNSEPFDVDPIKAVDIQMALFIGKGTVTVKAIDSDKNPVSFAQAEIWAEGGRKIGTLALNAQGTATPLELKADKRVYAVVRKDGHLPYFTSARQVLPGQKIEFGATLDRTSQGTVPKAELLGIFPKSGAKSSGLAAGMAYNAKFIMRVPSGRQYDAAGILMRIGAMQTLERDSAYINSANLPLAASPGTISRGETYNPPLGPPGGETPTGSNAKWVSASLGNPEAGTYEAEFELKVRDGATQGTVVPLYYRAWGVAGASWARDPLDSTLGNAESTSAKSGLYAESYEKSFIVGMDEFCSEDFCFSTSLLDETSGIFQQAPYRVKTFAPYKLGFTLTNNSQSIHDNAAITVRNSKDGTATGSEISIESYVFRNADSREFRGERPAFAVDPAAMGDFRQNKAFAGELRILPKSNAASAIEFSVVSSGTKVYGGFVQLLPFSEQDINVTIKPEHFPALVAIDMNVSAQYASGDKKGFGIPAARVTVRRIAPDGSESNIPGTTDAYGNATITIPASSPGTRLLVQVEKPGAGASIKEVTIGDAVAMLSPAALNISLNRQTGGEKRTELSIQSQLGKPLVVKKMLVLGEFRGLLDTERMNNFLKQYAGTEIAPNAIKGTQVLSALGSAAQELDAPVSVKGAIFMEIALKENPGISWISQVPMNHTINLAEMPANAPCISISANEWDDSTLSNRSSLEFEVQNNCVNKDGNPIELSNLQGKLDWSGGGGILGQVELSITDPTTADVSSEVLRQGAWSRMASTLKPRLIYPARLTFVPKPGSLGKKAEFTVNIDAQLITNSGAQMVGASNAIKATIMVANLDQCIEINPHPEEGLTIGRSETEQQFTIDTAECGKVPIDIRFCGGGSDLCRGGTSEGGVKVAPWSFSSVSETTREVKVSRLEMPGFYGLTVEAKPAASASWRKVADIDTIVEPEDGEYFTMDKYTFTAIGKGSKDSANLTNSMLQENIAVTANLCAWEEASPGISSAESAGIGLGGAAAGALVGYAAVALGLVSTGVGAVIGLVVFVVILFMTLFGDDPCEEFATHTLQDFVINLAGTADISSDRYVPPDALNILMSDSRMKGEWNIDITDAVQKINKKYPNGKQVVGAVFTNLNAVQDEPLYAIATMRSKEHVHGDATHQNAAVQCGPEGSEDGDFGFFWINPRLCNTKGGTYDTTYQQKFHLRFKVSEERASIQKVEFDTYACQSGTDIGRTGPGAIPRIKLNWSWKESTGGISSTQCDAQNKDYIYCDATQFTIEMNKRIYALNEFLAANNYNLGCPLLLEEKKEAEDQLAQLKLANDVPSGALGLKESQAAYDGKAVSIKVMVKNNTSGDQNITVKNEVLNTTGFSKTCLVDLRNIAPGAQREGSCSTDAPTGEGVYVVLSTVHASSSQAFTSNNPVRTGLYIGNPMKRNSEDACKLRTTETFVDKPHILRFIEGKSDIKWTNAVKDAKSLNELFKFDAYLQKDSYTKEFFADFADYYTNSAFEDADTYFHSMGIDSSGSKYGFNRLMRQGKFLLRQKYVDSPELPGPGLYHVELAVYYMGNDWRLFSASGETQGYVAAVLYKKDDPFPNSPFYSLPLDGLVGLKGNSFSRQNYGVAFRNDSQELLQISSGQVPLKSYEDDGSNPVNNATVRIDRGIYSLNTSPSTRGMLLQVSNRGGRNADIVFQPSHATPVMLRISRDTLSDQKFSSSYMLLQNNNPINVGSSLAYWDGAGSCLDYTGIPVTEAFYEKPDRQANESDKLADTKNFYTVEWPKAVKKGNVYLRTLIYTPQNQDVVMKTAQANAGTELLTPDSAGTGVPVNGIHGMPLNNFAAGQAGAISSIQDVFSMVSSGSACITNTGDSMKVFWNPKAVYERKGTKISVSELTNGLEAGASCIG